MKKIKKTMMSILFAGVIAGCLFGCSGQPEQSNGHTLDVSKKIISYMCDGFLTNQGEASLADLDAPADKSRKSISFSDTKSNNIPEMQKATMKPLDGVRLLYQASSRVEHLAFKTVKAVRKGTGLYKVNGIWKYYRNGKFTKATGIVQRQDNKKWYYVENGIYRKATKITRKVGSGNSQKYYVRNGVFTKKTGDVTIGGKKYALYQGVVQTSAWKKAYRNLLRETELCENNRQNDTTVKNIAIQDIGGNSIPELFVLTQDASGSWNSIFKEYHVKIYTCINGKVKKVKTFAFGGSGISAAFGYRLHLTKDGICYQESDENYYLGTNQYTLYSMTDGNKLKKTKACKMTYEPDDMYTAAYPGQVYKNGKSCAKAASREEALKIFDKKSGMESQIRGTLLIWGQYKGVAYKDLGMTRSQANNYLSK